MSGESKKSTTTQTEQRMWRRNDPIEGKHDAYDVLILIAHALFTTGYMEESTNRAYPVQSAVVAGSQLCVTMKNGQEFIVNERDVDEAVHSKEVGLCLLVRV